MHTPSISDFDYHLPDTLIARHPLEQRSQSRLLCVDNGTLSDKFFSDLPKLLNAGDLLVLNDTKVMKARLFGVKSTGGKVEMLIERILSELPDDSVLDESIVHSHLSTYPHIALCHIKASKAPKAGQLLTFGSNDDYIHACTFGRLENLFVVGFEHAILPLLDEHGQMPIPPYFERLADDNDDERYQSVFYDPAKTASVAAPTASLHFDDGVLQALKDKGIETAFVTLHVGAGTFAPVKTDDISTHVMHKEYAHLPQATADKINQTKQAGGKIIAVGTTVTRVLETAFLHRDTAKNTATESATDIAKDSATNQLSAWSGDTDIFIYPPYRFGVVDRLITNFHLPKSTLLMLVSAFAGTDNIKQAYAHAINKQYRFFSYGDAMLLDKIKD